MSETTEKKRTSSPVSPFVAEVTGNCCDVIVQSIPGCKLRGAITHNRTIYNVRRQKKETAPSGVLPGTPAVPGMQLHVYPGSCKVKIVDPLRGDEELCIVLTNIMAANGKIGSKSNLDGVPEKEVKLDANRMKTLCREILWMVKDNMVVIKKGNPPVMEDIEQLPGHFLLNPGSQIPNRFPKFEKDLEAFEQASNLANAYS